MNKPTYTHKGWFGICPAYLADMNDIVPVIDPRHWIFWPLMELSHWLQVAGFWVLQAFDPEYEPEFMILMTGEVKRETPR